MNPLLVRRLSCVAVAIAAAAGLSRCNRAAISSSRETPVIIISIDTLRSDRLPAYGYRSVETPHLDAFRNDGVLFERAYSHCPLTLPSHATMFTGRLPADNGVRDNLGFRLGGELPTLAETLKKNGYATGGAVSAFVLRRETGIARGFDFYDDDIASGAPNQSMGNIQREGAGTIDAAQRWIGEQSGKPFFFFLHLYEPHSPYSPPEPFLSRYPSRYDGEVAHVDALLGRFFEFLKDRGIYDEAMIIVTSDHGEGLNDHGEEEHGIFLYREAIQIPLIVKLPRRERAGSTIAAPVQLIDLFPTIAERTRAEAPKFDASARSIFVADENPPRRIFSETYYPRFHFGWSEMHSVIDASHHLISAPTAELYDVRNDVAEKKNVLRENRRVYADMRRSLEPLVKKAAAPTTIDPEEASKLAALGYIGSTVAETEGELPDPKEKIGTFRQIKAAFALFHAHKYPDALAAFRALLDENPRMLDLWDITARTLSKLGRTREAIAAAKEGLKLAPNTTHLQLMIANLSLEAGELDDAARHAELAVSADPGQAREILARIALARGDAAAAERQAKLALDNEKDRVVALLTLSRIELYRKNAEAALEYADRAAKTLEEKKRPPIVQTNFLRGDALARLGREAEAEAAFRKEIELFPNEVHAYRNLILLYVSAGRVEDATALVFDLVRNSPTAAGYVTVIETLRTIGDDRGARYWTRKARERFPEDPRIRELARS